MTPEQAGEWVGRNILFPATFMYLGYLTYKHISKNKGKKKNENCRC